MKIGTYVAVCGAANIAGQCTVPVPIASEIIETLFEIILVNSQFRSTSTHQYWLVISNSNDFLRESLGDQPSNLYLEHMHTGRVRDGGRNVRFIGSMNG